MLLSKAFSFWALSPMFISSASLLSRHMVMSSLLCVVILVSVNWNYFKLAYQISNFNWEYVRHVGNCHWWWSRHFFSSMMECLASQKIQLRSEVKLLLVGNSCRHSCFIMLPPSGHQLLRSETKNYYFDAEQVQNIVSNAVRPGKNTACKVQV